MKIPFFIVPTKNFQYTEKQVLRCRLGDLAKFGLLYLNKGIWNGQQIIPKSWVERITIEYTLTGLEGPISGHSYLWWVPADQKSRDLGFPEGTYIAAGAFAQFVMVVPAWDTVVVHQVDSSRLIFCTNLLALRGYLGGNIFSPKYQRGCFVYEE